MLALAIAAGSTFSVTLAQNELETATVPPKPAATTPAATPPAAPAAAGDAAQPEDAKARQRKLVEYLEDFMHYTRIHNFELASANAQALLDAGLTDEQFTALVDDSQARSNRFMDTVIRAQRQGEIEKLAAALQTKYELGRLAHSRDAAEITRNIKLLTGTQNERLFATQRLIKAGEYAMPQLFSNFLDRTDMVRAAQSRRVIVEMGRHAIIPLCTALPKLEPNDQEQVVSVLGDLVNPYTTSLPFLYELHATTPNERVKEACQRSIQRIAGAINPDIPVSTRFETLAVEYYAENKSLTNFPGEPIQLLWNFEPGAGLFATPIATPVFHEAMSMKMSERALRHNNGNSEALALWIAANFSREIDSPQNYDNPAYPATRRDATYYAVAAGPSVCERVLARAVDDRDTPLARRAIAAIEKTAGATAMVEAGVTTRRPLLEAVSYPNRRVQYDAALAVGAAKPAAEFPGADRIVPTLASAIRDASARYALVISDEQESDQAGYRQMLADRGYTVLPPGRSLTEVAQAIAESPGIDLIVTKLPGPSTDALVQEVRARPGLAATPVLAISALASYLDLSKKYDGDASTRVVREGLTNEQIGANADQLVEAAVGGQISPDESREYKLKALGVLRDLAVSNNGVLNIAYAAGPLMTALGQEKGDIKLRIAEVLSYLKDKSAQVALMDAALASSDDEQITLLGNVANSAKRAGNQLEQRQVKALVELAARADTDQQATAAAALMGALNLPNQNLIPLILGDK
jgi:hypothetical protein